MSNFLPHPNATLPRNRRPVLLDLIAEAKPAIKKPTVSSDKGGERWQVWSQSITGMAVALAPFPDGDFSQLRGWKSLFEKKIFNCLVDGLRISLSVGS